MSLQQKAAQEGDAEERSGEEHKWLLFAVPRFLSPSQHGAGKCKHHAGCFVKPDPAIQYLKAQRGTLLQRKSRALESQETPKWRCA